jgi:hypothetical protein
MAARNTADVHANRGLLPSERLQLAKTLANQPVALVLKFVLEAENRLVASVSKTGATGLEPATSGVTGRRSNQLNYAPRRA